MFKRNLHIVILGILVAFIGIFSVHAATTAPVSINTAVTKKTIGPYISDAKYQAIKDVNGRVVYCTRRGNKSPQGITMTRVSEANPGLSYIIQNGYPNKKMTGNDNYDYYITQTAVWWYLDILEGTDYIKEDFKSTAEDPNGLRKYIKALVEGAKTATYVIPNLSLSVSDTTLTLSNDKTYLISKPITVSQIGTQLTYSVSLTTAPTGTIITDMNNTTKTVFTAGEKFLVKVPVNSINTTTANVTIKVSATTSVAKAYMYQNNSSDIKYQPVASSILYIESNPIYVSKTFTTEGATAKIIKVDSTTGKGLAGATLELRNYQTNVIYKWISTTEYYELKNIVPGTYTLVETSAPSGYILNTTPQQVIITAGSVVKVTMKNTPNEIKIIKYDIKTNETLSGATLVIKNSNGTEIDKWVSTKEAHIIKKLPIGKYTVVETNAPSGYTLNKESVTFEVTASTSTQTINFYNSKNGIEVIKLDTSDGSVLPGATLVLKNSNDGTITTWITNDKSYSLGSLPYGTYSITETKAPTGYVLNTTPVYFTVDENTTALVVTMYNTKKEIEINYQISKRDVTNDEELPGAKLVIKDKDGNIIDSWTSTSTPHYLKNIKPGTYYLTETIAPAGFLKYEGSVEFEVYPNGELYTVVMYNTPDIPNTMADSKPLYIIGGIIMILGTGILFRNVKKEQ